MNFIKKTLGQDLYHQRRLPPLDSHSRFRWRVTCLMMVARYMLLCILMLCLTSTQQHNDTPSPITPLHPSYIPPLHYLISEIHTTLAKPPSATTPSRICLRKKKPSWMTRMRLPARSLCDTTSTCSPFELNYARLILAPPH